MPLVESRIAENLERLQQRIQDAAKRAGRAPGEVRLVAVTKSVGLEEARVLCALGVTDLAENRVDVARPKIDALKKAARWHMIGSVQRRKAADVVALFDTVDSVDRLELAEALDARCEPLGKTLPVLVEVNVSGEASKHGFSPEDLPRALELMARLRWINVNGLMTMAPFTEDPETVRPVFARLRALREELGLQELSMGMSNDFEVAIEEGATQVRIGTALFE